MASISRYLRGETEEILADVHGSTVVEVGDLMILNDTDGIIGPTATTTVAADRYAYPFNRMVACTAAVAWEGVIATSFLGVAMEASPSGTTEKITIATAGIFRYPIIGPTVNQSAVSLGSKVSAVSRSNGDSVTGVSTQTVVNHATQAGQGTTAYLGFCVKTESGASFIDFQIRTAYNQGVVV